MIEALAYVLRQPGVVPEIEEIMVEDQLQSGQVLIKILHTSFCGTQVEEIYQSSRNAQHMPHLFGHEASAKVLEIGPGVETILKGEEAVVHWRKSSRGLDAISGRYIGKGGPLSAGKVVTWSTHAVVPENRLSSIPTGTTSSRAALLGCSYATGWGAAVKTGRLKVGETVLIIGFGGVGRAAVIACRESGASTIAVVDPRNLRTSDLKALGVAHVYSSVEHALSAFAASKSTWPDLVIDTAGVVDGLEKVISQIPTKSRIVLVGMPKNGRKLELDTQKLLDGLAIYGSNGGDVDPGLDFQSMSSGLEKYVGIPSESGVIELDWKDLKKALEMHNSGLSTKTIFSVA
jgi:S-(hydroxymethyl)glutathione dehydrogenase/alcohol dehydrogenase